MDVSFNKGKFTGYVPREPDTLFMVHRRWFCMTETDKNISWPGRKTLAANPEARPALLMPTDGWKQFLQAGFFAGVHGITPSGLFPPA
jgi:hypothetical protein